MADQRILYTEQMVGAGHPTKADTLNRLALVEHNVDGTHTYSSDPRADGAVGDGTTSDKTALDLTFAHPVIQFPEGTFMGYDLSLSGVNKLSGMGQGSVIKCNSLAADFVVGFQDYPTPTGRTSLTLIDLVIDGNKALGTFTGTGHGLDLRGYDEVYIDRLEVKNAWGHGVIFGNCAKVRVGTLVVHDCDKYGVVFDANLGVGLAEEITIDTLISYSNGVAGGYSGINFSDITTTPAGSRKISIGKVYTFSNGRTGIAFGRNATATTTGPSDITVGEIHAYGNGNLGVELFGCKNVAIGSINTYSNTYAGVGIYHGDLNSPTYDYALAENISIGQIITHDNALDGVDIMGAFKLEIGSIVAYNNSIGSTTYSGVRFRANNPGGNANHNKDIHIGSILAYDDQGSPTQKYGVFREDTVHGGHVSIGHLRAYGNITADIFSEITESHFVDSMVINSWDVGTIKPSYADNVSGGGIRTAPFKIGGLFYGAGQTTDATIRSLVRIPIPEDKMCTVEAYIQCATDSTLANRASYVLTAAVLNDTAVGCNVVGSITTVHAVESNAGFDATITSGGAGVDVVTVQVTGLAGTTINWKAMVRVVEH